MELLTRATAIDSKTVTHYLPEGPTLEEALIAANWDMALADFTVVLVNGRDLPRRAWGDYRPAEGDRIHVILRPSGGGGGSGKSIIAAVAVIAIAVVAAVVAPYLAPLIAPTLGITTAAGVTALGYGIAAGITIAGSLLIGALIKPPSMANRTIGANPDNSSSDEGSIYSVSGASNQLRPYGVVPRIFGRVRVTPNHAADPFVVSSGPAQALRVLLDFGYGPLSVEDIRIGSTPITDFPTARYLIHPAYKAGDPLYIYTNDESTLQVGATLEQGVYYQRTLTQDANAAYLEFGFPGGLVEFDNQGQKLQRNEGIAVWARDVTNNGGWLSIGDAPHWAWFDSSHLTGIGQSGEIQKGSLNIWMAQASTTTIFVMKNGYVPQVGEFVRWMGGQYLVEAVGAITPPKFEQDSISVKLSSLPPGLPWGNGLAGPDWAYMPNQDATQPTVWSYGTPSAGGSLWVTWGPAPYDVVFNGITRIPRTVTVAMNFPYVSLWEIQVVRTSPVSTSTLVSNAVVWSSVRAQRWTPPIAPRVPRTIMELEVVATEQVNGQVQAINAVVTSQLYDPRYGLAVPSRNPAWAYAELLVGKANKNSVPWSRLEEAKLIEWADWCDEVSPQGDVNATCDLAVDYRTTVGEIAQTIAAAGRALPINRDGLYSVIMEDEPRTPIQMFTNRNAREFKFTRVWADEPHAVKVRYLSEATWDRDETIVYSDGYDQNNATKFDTLDLVGTVRPWQAWRMGRYYLGQLRLRKEKCELQTDVENLVCQRGDLVLVAHDRLLRSAVARVRSLKGGKSDLNLVPNWKGTGASPPSTPPTGWTLNNVGGWQFTVVGSGVEDGLPYTDFRLYAPPGQGNANNASVVFHRADLTAGVPWSTSVYVKVVAGDITGFIARMFIGSHSAASAAVPNPTTDSLISQPRTKTINPATTQTAAILTYSLATPAGLVGGDVTFRVAFPTAVVGSFPLINQYPLEDLLLEGADVTLDGIFDEVTEPNLHADIRLSDGAFLQGVPIEFTGPDVIRITDPAVANILSPGDVVAIGKIDTETTEWLVDSINPGSDLSAQLTLIEYAPALQTVDEAPIPPYVPPNSDTGFVEELVPVTDLALSLGQGFEGAFAVTFAKLKWLPPQYAVDHYIVERVFGDTPSGNRTIIATISDSSHNDILPTEGIDAGGDPVTYFVTPVTRSGKRGGTAEITGTIYPDTTAPDAPLFTSNVMGDMTRLLWTIPQAPDVVSYQVRYSPDYMTSVWADMQILAASISGSTNTLSVHTRSGLYAIKAFDRAGNASEPTFTRTVVEMAPAVDNTYDFTSPPWNGTFQNTELNGDGDLVLRIDPATGRYFSSGFFFFAAPLTLTQVWRIRAMANLDITVFPYDPTTSQHDAQAMISVTKTLPVLQDPWFTPLAHAIPLAGSPTAFGEYSPVIQEWYDAKIVRAALWLRSFNGQVTPVVKSAELLIFFDPRTENGNDVPAPGGILEVTYRFPFIEVPGLQITLNNGDKDDFVTRTVSTKTGFRIEVRSGNDQLVNGRNVDWVAVGYGTGLNG